MQGKIQARFGPTLSALEKRTIRNKRSFGPDHQLLLEYHDEHHARAN